MAATGRFLLGLALGVSALTAPCPGTAGNPTTGPDGQSYPVNANNQVTAGGFAFDGEGSPSLHRSAPIGRDRENRVSAVDGYNGGALELAYRGDGKRAWKRFGPSIPRSAFTG